MTSNSQPYQKIAYKIITAGDGGVGKTTLLHRYIEGQFLVDTKMTIGVGFFQKDIILDDTYSISLTLWDFGGEEHFRPFLDSYVLGTSGAILMFDLTRLKTLNRIDEWVSILRRYDKNLPIIFLGSKLDLEEFISVEDKYALEYKEKHHFLDFVKTSSKTNQNVDKAFELLMREIMRQKKHQKL